MIFSHVVFAALMFAAEPFFDAKHHATQYAGPGRELPEFPVTEVLLGYFGPSNPDDPEGGDAWIAAQLAIDEANRDGGYKGKPFRLVPAWSDQPWKSGATQVAQLVYRDRVWAIIGGPDGTTTHLAEQVAAKARLPIVSPTSTDRSAHLANVPWMFSILPGDHLASGPLADELVGAAGHFSVLLADDHDSRQFVYELQRAFKARRIQPKFVYTAGAEDPQGKTSLARVLADRPAAVVVAANANRSAAWVNALREGGYSGRILGSATMGRRQFQALPTAVGCVFPELYRAADDRVFAPVFQKRRAYAPDYAAAATYDTVRLLVAAVRLTGLNRARLGDALRSLSPWMGVAGEVRWDGLGSNARPCALAGSL